MAPLIEYISPTKCFHMLVSLILVTAQLYPHVFDDELQVQRCEVTAGGPGLVGNGASMLTQLPWSAPLTL